jgi:GntR family transcriptional regulator, transcriptional repressor for pyruvate dehydrogenase complex
MQTLRRRATLSDQVVKSLSERIASGQYKLGERLPSEQDLIDEFNVSRTVVREAIANLRASGRVTTMQGVGAFVVKQEEVSAFRIDAGALSLVKEMVSALELRIALESEAAVLAAQRRTDAQLAAIKEALQRFGAAVANGEDAVQADIDFHRSIADASGNDHFLKLFNYLGELLIPRAKLQAARIQQPSRDYLDRIQREHEQIFYAIEQGDSEAARAALRMHLSRSKQRLEQSLTQMSSQG